MPADPWHAGILNALVPPTCGLCARPSNSLVCPRCERELRRQPTFGDHHLPGIDRAWSAFEHSGIARRLVATAKYRARPALLDLAIEEMKDRLPLDLLGGSNLVPVPPDPWRHRRRGFDTAVGIAARLAILSDSQVTATLRRSRSAPQAGKGRVERLASEPRIRATAPLPTAIVLVDDVVTTGTTLAACATAARAAGATRVLAFTLTRTPTQARRNHGL